MPVQESRLLLLHSRRSQSSSQLLQNEPTNTTNAQRWRKLSTALPPGRCSETEVEISPYFYEMLSSKAI